MNNKQISFGLVVVIFLTSMAGCIGGAVDDGPKESDVPCFTPSVWAEFGAVFARAQDANGSGLILFTQQRGLQLREDLEDGREDFMPHDEVYQYDPLTHEFSVTGSANWDAALGQVASINGSAGNSGFHIEGNGGRTPLFFNEDLVSVEGGTAVKIYAAPLSPYVAVVSATGMKLISLFSPGQASGQHFHQLFSTENGAAVGPPVRIGIGGQDVGPVNGRWVANDRFVIHETKNSDGLFDLICIVDVQNVLNNAAKSNP